MLAIKVKESGSFDSFPTYSLPNVLPFPYPPLSSQIILFFYFFSNLAPSVPFFIFIFSYFHIFYSAFFFSFCLFFSYYFLFLLFFTLFAFLSFLSSHLPLEHLLLCFLHRFHLFILSLFLLHALFIRGSNIIVEL